MNDAELGGLFAFINSSVNSVDPIEKEVKRVVSDSKVIDFESRGNVSGKIARFDANIRAIRLLNSKENYDLFTKEEREEISLYSGWGGLQEAFDPKNTDEAWAERRGILKGLLEESDYISASNGVLDAFFTPDSIIAKMWELVERLGFEGGSILEPSCGVGRFLALTPQTLRQSVSFTCVEKDHISSKVASAVYPSVTIHNRKFEDFLVRDAYSLVIGNPPYGDMRVIDKNRKDLSSLNIHNYFIVKALDTLQMGGLLVFVVTTSFLDNLNSKLIELIDSRADFIGAIRLPSNTFASVGASVTTDIVVFKKRKEPINREEREEIPLWMQKGMIEDLSVNQYFLSNPEMVLGSMSKGYRSVKVVCNKDELEDRFKKAITNFPTNIFEANSYILPKDVFRTIEECNKIWIEDKKAFVNIDLKNGIKTLLISDKESAVKKIESYLELKKCLMELLDLQKDISSDDTLVEVKRAELNLKYDNFFRKYGYLNKQSNYSSFRLDSFAEVVLTLEKNYDKGISKAVAKKKGIDFKPESAEKADIFFKRTSNTDNIIKAESADDALIFSINEKGGVSIPYMCYISGKTEDEIIEELKGKIYFDEKNQEWVLANVFLSGDIKDKISYTTDSEALEALERVKPKDLTAKDIIPTIGASWISSEIIEQYALEELGFMNVSIKYDELISRWSVSGYGSSKYETNRRDAASILKAALNSTYIKVTDRDENGNYVVNLLETEIANSKKEELIENFSRWVYQDSERRRELVSIYNEKFNRNVPMVEDDLMRFYKPQGISKAFTPRPHQLRATYKAVFGETPMIFNHKVGSGKTLNAQMVAMELKRLGKANKPMIVTLKSVLPDFVRDFKRAYPDAVILAPSESDFTKSKRKMILSKIALGNYDCVVITHEQLKAIKNPIDIEMSILDKELNLAVETAEKAKSGLSGLSYKEVKKIEQRIEYKIEKLKSRKDDELCFDELGIDALLIDESHYFKKLTYTSSLNRIAGMPDRAGSQRAYDLYLKTKYILENNNNKNVIFLSGTVITNTLVELYLVQKYLQFDELEKQGLRTFDAWAKNYTEIITDIEISPSGKFVEKSRMSKFKNLDTLMLMIGKILDTVTNEDIIKASPDFKIPNLKNGKPTLVFIEPSEDQLNYVGQPDENGNYPEGSLVYRSENMPKDGSDNHLLLFTDAGKCAIDMRLIDDSYEDYPNSKINSVVSNVVSKYKEFTSVKGAQVIFCDTGVPKNNKSVIELNSLIEKAENGDEEAQKELSLYTDDEIEYILSNATFSVYEDIKQKLLANGFSADEVVFIQDYNSKAKKEELSQKMSEGEIRVLIGSTRKAGTGLNIQKRLVAVHHVDIPHMPSDLEQRNGRIIRQGNALLDEIGSDFEIEIFYYATKKTLDGVKWQTLERKAKFIEDFMKGAINIDSDDVLEHSTSELSEIMKAEASGNRLLMDKIKLDRQIKKLERLRTAFELEERERVDKIEQLKRWLPLAKNREFVLKNELKYLMDNEMIIFGEVLSNKTIDTELGGRILKTFREHKLINKYQFKIGQVGDREIKGLLMSNKFIIEIEGEIEIKKEFAQNGKGFMFVKWLKGVIIDLEAKISELIESQSYQANNLKNLEALEGRIFPHLGRLDELKEQLESVIKQMAEEAHNKQKGDDEVEEVA